MFTASTVFLKSLADAGVTHAFVNWGSDHPALLEELERQRSETGGDTLPRVVTCPHEMVALSAAQGFAQVTGTVAAVIVHVDVGTQGMAGAIHNVDRGRVPVLIYAGASPFTSENELRGTRNEWIMWLQDVPDQSAIVRQYMRFTSQLNSYKTIPQVVRRSLQIATSEPKGPVYLWARREVMEEEVQLSFLENQALQPDKWPRIEPAALAPTATTRIATALLTAQSPLIITSHLGRNAHAIAPLLTLSTLLAIPICSTCPSALNVPFSHPFFTGVTYLQPGKHTDHLATADVILIIESDIPWVPTSNKPSPDARVFILDSGDPLKLGINFWHVDAEMVCRADGEIALGQLLEAVREVDQQLGSNVLGGQEILDRAKRLSAQHKEWVYNLDLLENDFRAPPDMSVRTGSPLQSSITVPNVIGVLRKTIQAKTPNKGMETLVLNEGITNYPDVWTHMRSEVPGSVLTGGGSSLGWALGAAIGAYIGGEMAGAEEGHGYELIVAIVGDGSFLFGIPSSVYWMARKYNTPFLTIVLNNGGWRAPKLSMLRMHPNGHGSAASGDRLSVGFGPDCPDFAQIAVAASAGWAWGQRVGLGESSGKAALEHVMSEAVRIVVEERRCAVVECVLDSI